MDINLDDYHISIESLRCFEEHSIDGWINSSKKPEKTLKKLRKISKYGGSRQINSYEINSTGLVSVMFLVSNGKENSLRISQSRIVNFLPLLESVDSNLPNKTEQSEKTIQIPNKTDDLKLLTQTRKVKKNINKQKSIKGEILTKNKTEEPNSFDNKIRHKLLHVNGYCDVNTTPTKVVSNMLQGQVLNENKLKTNLEIISTKPNATKAKNSKPNLDSHGSIMRLPDWVVAENNQEAAKQQKIDEVIQTEKEKKKKTKSRVTFGDLDTEVHSFTQPDEHKIAGKKKGHKRRQSDSNLEEVYLENGKNLKLTKSKSLA